MADTAVSNYKASSWGTRLSSEQALALSDPFIKVFAPIAGGKTEFLASKVAALASSGVDLSQVLIAVNTDADARTVIARLVAKNVATANVSIYTPQMAFTEYLKDIEVGRRIDSVSSRYLVRAELNIVLEDLKAQGHTPRVLKSLLSSLKSNLASSSDFVPEQLDPQEQAAYRSLSNYLRKMGVCLREELPHMVLGCQNLANGTVSKPYSYVLVDDAQNYCPATIDALASLASVQVIVVGNSNQARPGFDPCFSESSFDDCLGDKTCQIVSLEQDASRNVAACALAQTLCNVDPTNASVCPTPKLPSDKELSAITCIKWREPEDEFKGVARIAANLLTADPLLLPQDIFISVPNRLWAKRVEDELDRRHLPWQSMFGEDLVSGDPRSFDTLDTLEAYAVLSLAHDSTRLWAWRFWLSLGSNDFALSTWLDIEIGCLENKLDICKTLFDVSNGIEPPLSISAELVERLHQVGLLLSGIRGKTGLVLAGFLRKHWESPRMRAFLEKMEGSEDASLTFALMQAQSSLPCFSDRPSLVRLGSAPTVHGIEAKHVIVCGLIDGLVPSASSDETTPEARTIRKFQRRSYANLFGTSREDIVLCTTQRAALETADAMKLPIRRTRRYQGREVAVFARSSFIEDAVDALPGSVSGEQYFIDNEER